jgi:hypothetical protein
VAAHIALGANNLNVRKKAKIFPTNNGDQRIAGLKSVGRYHRLDIFLFAFGFAGVLSPK